MFFSSRLSFSRVAADFGLTLVGALAFANDAFAQRTGSGTGQPVAPGCSGSGCPQPRTPGCSGGSCGTTFNSTTNQNFRLNYVAPPAMALSSGECMEGISMSLGTAVGPVPLGLGFSTARFSKLCGKLKVLQFGAANPTCIPAVTSLAMADGKTVGQGLELAADYCLRTAPRRQLPVVTDKCDLPVGHPRRPAYCG